MKIRNLVDLLDSRGLFHWMSDEMYLKFMFRIKMRKKLDLENPSTFSEKVQWLKLHDRRPEYTTMVDKYAVKEYVAKIIGSEYVIPTLGVWESFDDIDFDSLPNQFVLKCTHDSGGLVICKDKTTLDKKAAKQKIEKCLKRNYYWMGREWPYKNVPPRIIAEEYMEDAQTHELRDYKFFAFEGVVKTLFAATERQNKGEETKFDFFDMEFRHLDFRIEHPNATKFPAKPQTFDKMRELTERLSERLPQVRVDFYEVNGKTYFGELTFAHWSEMVPFEPEESDRVFGDWVKLSEECGGYCVINEGFVLYIHEMQENNNDLVDYKFYCFSGEPVYCQIIKNRSLNETIDFFDMNWNHQEFTGINQPHKPHYDGLIFKPYSYEWMIETARILSKGIPFVRVDFYEINCKPYFGELTFYPASGFGNFAPEFWNIYMGGKMNLY